MEIKKPEPGTEYINFMKPGEKPDSQVMLSRMSEWGQCLLTGVKEDLAVLPVDLDPGNVLASNMAQISKSLTKSIAGAFNYEVALTDEIFLSFTSAPLFEPYNMALVEHLKGNPVFVKEESMNPLDFLYGVHTLLTSLHMKGIDKVTYRHYSLTSPQYLRICLGTLARSQSKIIKPESGLKLV
jgi:hypothetical protein